MPSYVSRPALVFPPYEVTLDDVIADIRRTHPDHPRLKSIGRILQRTEVRTRRYSRPLEQVVRTEPFEERNRRTFADLCALGEQAARDVLAGTGLRPADVDCVITSHSTGIAVPGLDVHLIDSLGLAPTVSRIPMTQFGCTGGAFALIRAAEYLRAHPGRRVLIVVSEVLSTVYQHSDTSVESMIYKALFGDSAGAVVVSDSPLGAGLVIEDSWEYTLPRTADRYRLRVDATGQHFDSTRAALESAGELVPPLRHWYGSGLPNFLVAHTGGPRILEDLETGLGCDPKLLQHSWSSLRERGNLGGVAVLDVLDRHHGTPPADGAPGLLIGMGPGFSGGAVRGYWSVD